MLAAAILSAILVVVALVIVFSAKERMLTVAQPLGGDFINLYAAAQMLVQGHLDGIYLPDVVMAFERTIIDAYLGLRLWAYPPHAFFFIWPFGLMPFEWAFASWSVLSVSVLTLAARRYGFSWSESLLLTFSPAAIVCLLLGQTGLLVTAFVLSAYSARSARDGLAIAGTAILTVKPQAGFIIPVLWLLRRQYRLVVLTSIAILALIGASIAVFGIDAWRSYLLDTVSVITTLEKQGSGPFMLMMPSLFMAARLVGIDGGLAFVIHLVFAVPVALWLLLRLSKCTSQSRQNLLALVGVTLITPYLHIYDLPLLSAAVLIALREPSLPGAKGGVRQLLLVLAWFLPLMLMPLNAAHVPLAPLLLMALFIVV